MFQKQDIYWIGLACSLMVGGYSLIWSSQPEIRSFKFRDEITAQQELPDSNPEAEVEAEAEAEESSTAHPVLELAKTNPENTVQD